MATKKTNNFDLSVFNTKVDSALLAQAVYVYQSNSHQNTSKVKSRGEINRTTKKAYKQKHTGNARHGARSAPIFVGGGVAHGPTGIKPAIKKLNQKMKLLSLAGSLSNYCQSQLVVVIDPSIQKSHSTKSALQIFPSGWLSKSTTLAYSKESPDFVRSVSNLKNLNLISASRLNILDVLSSRYLVLTANAYTVLVNRLKKVL